MAEALQIIGIGGFIADVRINESITKTSEAPDNVVEDGSVINDHIILNADTISIDGEVANVHIQKEFNIIEEVVKYDKANGIIDELYPSNRTEQQTEAIEELRETEINDSSVYTDVRNHTLESNKDNFIDFLNNIHRTKQLIDIDVGSQTLTNMRITDLTIISDSTTNEAISYKIFAKEIRFAKTILVEKSKYFKAPTPSVKNKTKAKVNKGTIEGIKKENKPKEKESEKSFLYTLLED